VFFRRKRRQQSQKVERPEPEEQARLLEDYLREKSSILAQTSPDRAQPIFTSGILDSLDFADLVTFIGDTFGVDLWLGAVAPEDLDSIDAMLVTLDREYQHAVAKV